MIWNDLSANRFIYPSIGYRSRISNGFGALCRVLLGKLAQTLFFLLPLFFQISLAFFKRVIWFCQNIFPFGTKAESSPTPFK